MARSKLSKARWRAIYKKYGLTEEQWWKIYEEQEGLCFICGRRLKLGGKNTRFSAHTDHCHQSGRVRGILCRRCNMDLVPFFEKDPKQAKRLFTYLTRKKSYGYVPTEG